MKRDMDLARAILLAIEEHPSGYAPKLKALAEKVGADEGVTGYHVHLLGQAGLLKVADITHNGSPGPMAIPVRMTWEGHEFLDNTRDSARWTRIKEAANAVGTTGLQAIGKIAADIAAAALKSHMGL